MIRLAFLFSILFISASSFAQEEQKRIDYGIIVIHSSKSYNSALRKAQVACNKLGLPLDLRGYIKGKFGGLESPDGKAAYEPRMGKDQTKYISIEYSSQYSDMKEDRYIVVVSSDILSTLNATLTDVQKHYKKAFIQSIR